MYNFYHVTPKDPLELKALLLKIDGDISFFDADKLICESQLIFALERANHAFNERNNIAETWGLEVLLELSGQHQIKRALDILEITEETKLVIIVTKGIELEFDEGIPELSKPNQDLAELYKLPYNDRLCNSIIVKGAALRS